MEGRGEGTMECMTKGYENMHTNTPLYMVLLYTWFLLLVPGMERQSCHNSILAFCNRSLRAPPPSAIPIQFNVLTTYIWYDMHGTEQLKYGTVRLLGPTVQKT